MTLDLSPFQMAVIALNWVLGFAISRSTEGTKTSLRTAIPLLTTILAGITQLVEKAAELLGAPPAVAPALASFASVEVFQAASVGGVLGTIGSFVFETLAQTWITTGAHSWQKHVQELRRRGRG